MATRQRLGMLLVLALATTIGSSCDLLDQAGKGLSQGFSSPQAQNQAQQQGGVPGMGQPATQAEVDTLWKALSEDDKALLADVGIDKSYSDGFVGVMDAATIGMMLDSQLEMLRPLELHDAGVKLGAALGWKSILEVAGSDEYYVYPIVANLDADPQSELLLTQDAAQILELDGSMRLLEQPAADYLITAAWDMDHDGIDELLAMDFGNDSPDAAAGIDYTYSTVVLNLAGERLANLDGSSDMATLTDADIDGDGFGDVLLAGYDEAGTPQVRAYGKGGKELWKGSMSAVSSTLVHGDIDGDGMDELLGVGSSGLDPYSNNVQAFGLKQEATDIPGLSGNPLASPPSFCVAISAEGPAAILLGTSLLNAVSGERLKLARPEGWQEMQLGMGLDWGSGHGYAVIERNGQRLLAARIIEGLNEYRSDTIGMWNSTGELVYLEFLGEEINDLQAVQGESGDALLIQTSSGLKVSQ
ncbi:MAG: hypothetical protein R3F46_13620 [bacterium]